MAKRTAWETHMKRAAAELSRACADAAAGMESGTTGIKEIRELAGAMKDLAALHAALEKPSAAPDGGVQVSFDHDSTLWRA